MHTLAVDQAKRYIMYTFSGEPSNKKNESVFLGEPSNKKNMRMRYLKCMKFINLNIDMIAICQIVKPIVSNMKQFGN